MSWYDTEIAGPRIDRALSQSVEPAGVFEEAYPGVAEQARDVHAVFRDLIEQIIPTALDMMGPLFLGMIALLTFTVLVVPLIYFGSLRNGGIYMFITIGIALATAFSEIFLQWGLPFVISVSLLASTALQLWSPVPIRNRGNK